MTDEAQKLGLLLPKSLVLKASPEGYNGLGVFVLKKVKAGVVYGPYKGQLIQKEALTPDIDTTRMWEVKWSCDPTFLFRRSVREYHSCMNIGFACRKWFFIHTKSVLDS